MNYELRQLSSGSAPAAGDEQSLQGDLDRSRLLLEINNAVVSHLDLEGLLKAIFDTVKQIFKRTTAATLSIYDAESNKLRIHLLHSQQPETFREGMLVSLEETPSGLAFTSRQIVLIHRLALEDFPSPLIERILADGVRSACSVPLISHNHALGTLTVAASDESAFSEADAELLAQVAEQIAMPIENALNFLRAERERDRAQLVLEAGNAIVSNLDLRDLLMATSRCLRKYFKHEFFGLSLYDEESGELRVYALDTLPDGRFAEEGVPIDMEGTPAGLAFTTRRPVLREHLSLEEFHSPMVKAAYEAGLRSGCAIPLISRERPLGVIALASLREAAFTREDVELLQHIANEVAIAVENVLNFRQAARERDRIQLLLEVNNAVASHLDLRELLHAISASLRTVIPHEAAGLVLYEAEHKQLRVHVMDAWPELRHLEEGFLMPINETPAGRSFTTRRPLLINKLDTREYPSPIVARAVAGGFKSSCNAPLLFQGQALGAVFIGSKTEAAFTQADLQLFNNIAGQLSIAVANALSYREIDTLKQKLTSEKLYLEEEIQTEYNFAEIVGQSAALKKILQQVATVAPTDSAVLLCGETGTGKELIARAIHNLSARRERTLVKLNCAAIPTGLLESELFGHEKGAFTGAIAQRVGRFELAHKGTLLLDEVGEIPLELQPKLLRVLQEQEFERLGSSRTIKTDVRLIAATNCDLPQMVAEKKFRSDLFYRLNVFPITIPPLRERMDDISLLVGYFTQKHSLRMNKRIETVSKETIEALCRYPWPGNVRELENFVERAVILTNGSELQAPLSELKTSIAATAESSVFADAPLLPPLSKPVSLEDVERAHIEEILRQTRGVIGGRGGAAEILGLPISTLRNRIKKLGLK